MPGWIATAALALQAAAADGAAAPVALDPAAGAPYRASAPILAYDLKFAETLRPAPEAALTAGASLRVRDALESDVEAALRTGDWRSSRVRLGDTARLSVSLYDPADPRLPLNGLQAGAPLTAAELAAEPDALTPSLSVNIEKDLIRLSDGPYDFALSPRAVYASGPDGSVAGMGAIARIGRNLEKRRASKPSWYFFAGADAEALTIDPAGGLDFAGSLRLEHYAIVGDAQAGVAVSWGPADIALAYVQKEREYSSPSYGISRSDDFAALSVSLRR